MRRSGRAVAILFASGAFVASACGATNSSPNAATENTEALDVVELSVPVPTSTGSPNSTPRETVDPQPAIEETIPPTTLPEYVRLDPPVVPAYDTAWEMAYLATEAEIVAYLDHVYVSGFSGFWFLALPFGGSNLYRFEVPGTDGTIAVIGDDETVSLTPSYTNRINFILDEAHRRHLRVGLVAAWAKANSCKTAGITVDNALAYGTEVGRSFDHPALDYWVLGGDLPFEESCVAGNPQDILEGITQRLEQGIRAGGANQPVAFHTGAGVANYDQLLDRDYVDAGAVQTGHCQDASSMQDKLRPVIAATSKPVILAESRYYQLGPRWPGCLHSPDNPVSADDIRSDAEAALASGVAGILFGDAQRYQWCRDRDDGQIFDLVNPDYGCSEGISSTFDSPGEEAFLGVVRPR